MTNCGNGTESCCTSLLVDAGSYYRTYTNPGDGGRGESNPASVSSFRLDEYLVTVGRFRQFVAAWADGKGWMPSAGSGVHSHLHGGKGLIDVGAAADAGTAYESGWLASYDPGVTPTDSYLACGKAATWTRTAGLNENLPINCLDWYEAYAFCIWDGGFLPSEAEWEYAAAGGSEQREYPWGSTAPGNASAYAIYGCYYPPAAGGHCPNAFVAPVGTATRGGGRWGQLDMGGEVWELVLDWYMSYVDPCDDGAYLQPLTTVRVARGGCYSNADVELTPPTRPPTGFAPSSRTDVAGVRCARTP